MIIIECLCAVNIASMSYLSFDYCQLVIEGVFLATKFSGYLNSTMHRTIFPEVVWGQV